MAAAVAVAAGAALGSGGAASMSGPLNGDDFGVVSMASGTSPTTGVLLTITLGGNYTNNYFGAPALRPKVTSLNAATAALGPVVTAWTGRVVTVSVSVAPAASQTSGTYKLAFET